VIEELEIVALNHDLPSAGLKAGDKGTVVMVFNDGEAYEVEFVSPDGCTLALETLRAGEVRPVRGREAALAREIA
jgi:hypothetical protein